MKLAFKGFDNQLSCRGTKFEFGITYSTSFHKDKSEYTPTLCTSEGYHYCSDLSKVYEFYKNNGNNRFFIIEILGRFTEDGIKGTTTSFRIIKEITMIVDNFSLVLQEITAETNNYEDNKKKRDELEKVLTIQIENNKKKEEIKKELREEIKKEEENKKIEDEDRMAEYLKLEVLKKIQSKIHCHVGGSLGLFLHGVRLKRFLTTSKKDLDLIIPQFTLFEGMEDIGTFEWKDAKNSGNDFDETFLFTEGKNSTSSIFDSPESIMLDIKIDPKQRYEVIEFRGYKYKVSKFETIMEAKLKYAFNKQSKHMNDLKEMALR